MDIKLSGGTINEESDIIFDIYNIPINFELIGYSIVKFCMSEEAEFKIFGFDKKGEKRSYILKGINPFYQDWYDKWHYDRCRFDWLAEPRRETHNKIIKEISFAKFTSLDVLKLRRKFNNVYNESTDRKDFIIKLSKYVDIIERNINKDVLHNIVFPNDRHIDVRREYCNDKRGTFDFVIVSLFIGGFETRNETLEFIKSNRKEIDAVVIDGLNYSKKFTRYNISTNFLKLDSLLLDINNHDLIYTFSLKELKED